jgi:aconitate hydratase 2/2-methylisocitrate dehydratase
MGDVIDVLPYDGKDRSRMAPGDRRIHLKSDVILDEVRAGGRIQPDHRRGLTAKAREFLGLPASTLFRLPPGTGNYKGKGFTLAQKMVGRACGLPEGQGCARAPIASLR